MSNDLASDMKLRRARAPVTATSEADCPRRAVVTHAVAALWDIEARCYLLATSRTRRRQQGPGRGALHPAARKTRGPIGTTIPASLRCRRRNAVTHCRSRRSSLSGQQESARSADQDCAGRQWQDAPTPGLPCNRPSRPARHPRRRRCFATLTDGPGACVHLSRADAVRQLPLRRPARQTRCPRCLAQAHQVLRSVDELPA